MLTNNEINDIQNKIGYKFNNLDLLNTAFTHSSVANSTGNVSNERLEFLGDSILNFVTTEFLYNNYGENEGLLSKAKAYLVSAKYLSLYIKKINVINYLHCKTFNPSSSENVMGDLFEAILGAIYEDCLDVNVCKQFVFSSLNCTKETLERINEDMFDYKTKLQELVQENPKNTLKYVVLGKTGLAHKPEYEVAIFVNNEEIARAKSVGKKEAEVKCAKLAFNVLSNKNSKI